MDNDFVLATTVTDSDADLNTFTSGAHVRVKVTALNARGESQPRIRGWPAFTLSTMNTSYGYSDAENRGLALESREATDVAEVVKPIPAASNQDDAGSKTV